MRLVFAGRRPLRIALYESQEGIQYDRTKGIVIKRAEKTVVRANAVQKVSAKKKVNGCDRSLQNAMGEIRDEQPQ